MNGRVFKFTLIELLVVVAIIGILVSILMPSLQNAREKARIAVDISNQSQSVKGIMTYADDNDSNIIVNSAPHLNTFKWSSQFNLAVSYKDYINFDTFKCIETDAPPIDDPGNTRWALYMTLLYFPGRQYPDLYPGENIPASLTTSKSTASTPLLSCGIRQNTSVGYFGQHTRGAGVYQTYDSSNNPSMCRYKVDTLEMIRGTVITYLDGHGVWKNTKSLKMYSEKGDSQFYTWTTEPD